MCRYRHNFFSFITVIDICDLIVTHIICLINNYNTNTNAKYGENVMARTIFWGGELLLEEYESQMHYPRSQRNR